MKTIYTDKPHALLDKLLDTHCIKNDAALSRELGVKPSTICKIRGRSNDVGCEVILSIHEKFGMPVREIRMLAKEALEQTPLRAPAAKQQPESQHAA